MSLEAKSVATSGAAPSQTAPATARGHGAPARRSAASLSLSARPRPRPWQNSQGILRFSDHRQIYAFL
eukprot:6805551-Prymnesium_polylepis.1